jgi:hypothetical protein
MKLGMRYLGSIVCALIVLCVFPANAKLSGSHGAPLGGVGAGALKFQASSGTLAMNELGAPCLSHDFVPVKAMFQFMADAGNGPVYQQRLKSVEDDGVFPVHTADFGKIEGLSVEMKSFSPVDFDNVKNMCYPWAFLEFTVTNTTQQTAQCGWAFAHETAQRPSPIHNCGLIWNDKVEGAREVMEDVERAALVNTDFPGAEISYGGGSFETTGRCTNEPVDGLNRLAVHAELAPGESLRIECVLAWYVLSYSGAAGYPDRYYYTNDLYGAEEAVLKGVSRFSSLRDNAIQFVGDIRGSSLPEWLEDQLLVSLSVLTTNTWYTSDRRFCMAEGSWDPNGTMDQMWHSRQILNHLVPELAAQELRYWARTQKTDPEGQIHHDFGKRTKLYGWDDRQHKDYRNIDLWVDLNAGFIFCLYEFGCATGDTALVRELWPAAVKAGNRILDQLDSYHNSQYPHTFEGTESTYDSQGHEADTYNTGLASVAFKLLVLMGEWLDDAEPTAPFAAVHPKMDDEFEQRWLTAGSAFELYRGCENVLAGQWMATFLDLGDLYTPAAIAFGVERLREHYKPAEQFGVYRDWQHYVVSHLGGILLQTGYTSDWYALQEHMAKTNLAQTPYNQGLYTPGGDSTFSSKDHYLTAPVVFRNYYTIGGVWYNAITHDMHLAPKLPDASGDSFENLVLYFGNRRVRVDYAQWDNDGRESEVKLTPDAPLTVDVLDIEDRFDDGESPYVYIDGAPVEYERTGSGSHRRIRVAYGEDIPVSGMQVRTSMGPVGIRARAARRQTTGLVSPPVNRRTYDLRGKRILGNSSRARGVIITIDNEAAPARELNISGKGKRP